MALDARTMLPHRVAAMSSTPVDCLPMTRCMAGMLTHALVLRDTSAVVLALRARPVVLHLRALPLARIGMAFVATAFVPSFAAVLRAGRAINLRSLFVASRVTLVPSFMAKFLAHFSALTHAVPMARMANVVADEPRIAPRKKRSPMKEGAMPVIARPVGVYRERDDRNVHLLGIDRQQDPAIMVKKFQIARVDPSAVA